MTIKDIKREIAQISSDLLDLAVDAHELDNDNLSLDIIAASDALWDIFERIINKQY